MNCTGRKTRWSVPVFACILALLWAVPSNGDEQKTKQLKNAEPVKVQFFAAIQEQKIDVRVVPSSYSRLAMRVRNVTKQPLEIELPKTFAAVPLARMQAKQQLQMRGVNASLGANYGQNFGNSQGLGGSLGGPWWGDSLGQGTSPGKSPGKSSGRSLGKGPDAIAVEGTQQPGPQSLTIAPGRFVQAQLPCFCLEFGKPDPNSRIPYVICPLEELNNRPTVADLLQQFAERGIDQYVAQLAAWHLASDVPWQKLTQVQFPRTKHSRGHRVTQVELVAAKNVADAVRVYRTQSSLSDN